MQQVLDIRNSDDPRDVIHLAVQALVHGELVVFPSETSYLITGYSLQKQALKQLAETADRFANEGASSRGAAGSCLLSLKNGAELADFAGSLSNISKKLSRRSWPGPVNLSISMPRDDQSAPTLLSSFSPPLLQLLENENRVQYRVPAHDAIQDAMRLLPAPLVVLLESRAEGALLTNVEEVQKALGDQPALIIDDGPSRYGQPASVVEIHENQWNLSEKGVVSESTIRRLASDMYLFVCTGNTCRSPMAEALFRKGLSDRLDCLEDELFDRGYIIESAGLAALPGMQASPDAAEVVGKSGADLSAHQSQPLTNRLIDQADYIYVMTKNHKDSLLAARPDVAERVQLLSSKGTDISDPIGGGRTLYEECKSEIEQYVREIVNNINLIDQ